MLHSVGRLPVLRQSVQALRQGGQVRRRVRTATFVSLIGSLGILLAACSSGSANAAGSKSTSTTTPGSSSAQFAAYESCLKSHGVTFSPGDFRPGAGGTSPSSGGTTRTTLSPSARTALEKASAACASLRPKFNGTGTGGSTAFAAYRNCLKLHGVTLPTGRGAGGFGGFDGGSTSTTYNAKLQAAEAACAALRPKGGFGGFGGSTTTTS